MIVQMNRHRDNLVSIIWLKSSIFWSSSKVNPAVHQNGSHSSPKCLPSTPKWLPQCSKVVPQCSKVAPPVLLKSWDIFLQLRGSWVEIDRLALTGSVPSSRGCNCFKMFSTKQIYNFSSHSYTVRLFCSRWFSHNPLVELMKRTKTPN